MPQFNGDRLTAVAALLGLFGLASLPLTYFLHFLFAVNGIHSCSCCLVLSEIPRRSCFLLTFGYSSTLGRVLLLALPHTCLVH